MARNALAAELSRTRAGSLLALTLKLDQYAAVTNTALIVEDEIFLALDLERILLDAGYEVAAIAADCDTALEAAPRCGFAFVDINLRDGATGSEIARRLECDHGVKVVFVTANPAQIDPPSGGVSYVRKPFSEAAIVAAARSACGERAVADSDLVRLEPTPRG